MSSTTRAVLLLSLLPGALAAQHQSPAPGSFYIAVTPSESLHVVTAGAGEPVVLVPGLFGCAFGFRHLLGRLPARGYRVIVIEPLAVGSSGRPERADYSLTAQADRLAAVIERLERRPVLLAAQSVNASTVMRLAVRRPGLVRGLVLLDGGPMESAATKGFRRAMSYAPWVKWMGGMKRLRPRIRRDLIASSVDSSWITPAVLDRYTAGAAADLDGTLKAYLRMANAREPEKLAPRLREIRVPVRLVLGDAAYQGRIPSEQIDLLAEWVPRFTVERVRRAGHYLYEEAPEAVVAAILRTDQSARTVISSAEVRP